METKPLRCAIYARFSSEKQNPLSAKDQVSQIIKKASGFPHLKILTAYIYEAEGISGKNLKKNPVFQEMLEAANKTPRPFDAILIEDMSRFSRNDLQSKIARAKLNDLGIQVLCLSDNFQSVETDEDELKISVLESVAKYERKKIASRSRRGNVRQLERGYLPGGCISYGYIREQHPTENMLNTKPIPEPFQAEIVKRIWSEYAEGKSCRQVVDGLNNDSIPPPQPENHKGEALWNSKQISRIIHNQAYVGILFWDKEGGKENSEGDRIEKLNPKEKWQKFEGIYPRIVPEDLEQKVKQRLAANEATYYGSNGLSAIEKAQRVKQKNFSKYLLTGFVKCADCGGNFYTDKGKYYVCLNRIRKGPKACKNKVSIPRWALEQSLIYLLKGFFLHPRFISFMLKRAWPLIGKEKVDSRISSIQALRAKLNKQIDALTELCGREPIDILAQKLEKLKSDRDSIDAQLTESLRETRTVRVNAIQFDVALKVILQKFEKLADIPDSEPGLLECLKEWILHPIEFKDGKHSLLEKITVGRDGKVQFCILGNPHEYTDHILGLKRLFPQYQRNPNVRKFHNTHRDKDWPKKLKNRNFWWLPKEDTKNAPTATVAHQVPKDTTTADFDRLVIVVNPLISRVISARQITAQHRSDQHFERALIPPESKARETPVSRKT